MFREVIKRVKEEIGLQLLLLLLLVIQIITTLNQPGFFHPDQHFQIIEFSSYQLGKETGATKVWELASGVRSTVQVYMYSGFRLTCEAVGIMDPYTQNTIMRFIISLLMFSVFSVITIYYLKEQSTKIIILALLLLNASWFFPYIKTLFSSEVVSALLFFPALVLYHRRRNKENNFLLLLLIGFLLSIAFYVRFQMGFAIAGFGLWLLLIDKNYKAIPALAIGFLLGVALNTFLDYSFYGRLVITPYQYFHVNITEGKAASFGTSGPFQYLVVLLGFFSAPPLSILLLILSFYACIKFYRHPFVLPVIFFIIGHSMVAHKEERFIYPILFVLPLFVGWVLTSFIKWYRSAAVWKRYGINIIIGLGALLNVIALVLLLFNPYAQTVAFSKKLRDRYEGQEMNIYCLKRTPFQTESILPIIYYAAATKNLHMIRIPAADTLRTFSSNTLLATTYNDAKNDKALIDSLGFKPIVYSNKILWKLNGFLDSKKANTINDIWVLYQKQ